MEAMLNGTKRAVCVWHRRAGKDSASLNFTAVEAHRKIANYWHMLPTAIQGRHVVWDSVNPATGQRVIDQVFPQEIRVGTNNTEMKIELQCGSTWQVVGSDNYDRLVGSNPYGVIFSEYSIADPRAWDFIRPILAENGGWAIFIYTSRGKNHGYDLYEMAKNNPDWFCELLNIDTTLRNDGTPVITKKQFEAEIAAGMDRQLALQEFYCSFDAGLFGAYYTEEIKHAKVGSFTWNPRKPVHTFWDIGLDTTAIWFGQESTDSGRVNIIDYEAAPNISFQKWIKELKEKPYTYGIHSMPHDFKKRDWKDLSSGPSMAENFNFPTEQTPDLPRNQGIDAAKNFLPICNFNNTPSVMRGYDGLTNYRREYNDKLRIFMDRPLHDWASHPADAFRYMAIAWPENYVAHNSAKYKVIGASKTTRDRITKRPKIRNQNEHWR